MSDKPSVTVIPLDVPIQYGSETITKLTFQRPKAKHFRKLPVEGITLGHIIDMMGGLCGQPPSVMDELDAEDLSKVEKVFEGFSKTGRKTGEKA